MSAALDIIEALVRGCRAAAQRDRRSPHELGPGYAWMLEQLIPDDEGLLLALVRDQGCRLEHEAGATILTLPTGREVLVPSKAAAMWLTNEFAFCHERVPHPDTVRRAMAILPERAQGAAA